MKVRGKELLLIIITIIVMIIMIIMIIMILVKMMTRKDGVKDGGNKDNQYHILSTMTMMTLIYLEEQCSVMMMMVTT